MDTKERVLAKAEVSDHFFDNFNPNTIVEFVC
jgi:hypothetical protein